MGQVLHSIQSSLGYWKIIMIVYCFQLMLALTIGLQVYDVLDASMGHSVSMHELLDGYDYTIINDFLLYHGASITPLVGQLRWLILVYMVFSVFINAGILYSLVIKESSWKIFFSGGAQYFFVFFKLLIFFLPVTLIWTCILWLPFFKNSTWLLEYLPTEKVFFGLAIAILIIYIFGLAFLNIWMVMSKLEILHNKGKVIHSIKKGIKVTFMKFFQSHFIFYFMMFLVLVVSLFNAWITRSCSITTWFAILIMLVSQQLILLFRLTCRYAYYIGLDDIFRGNSNTLD